MGNRVIVFLFVLIFCFEAVSQNFGALPYLGNGPAPYYLERIFTDPVHDKLILSSRYVNYAGNKKVRGAWSWNGVEWDSLKSGINTHDVLNNQANGTLLCGTPYNGKFLVGGIFQSIGAVNASGLATWDGTKWDSLSVRAFRFLDYYGGVYKFINYNNKLFIGGIFDSIQGQKANGLATFDGTSFQPVPMPLNSQATIIDMAVFNSELYIAGIFTYTGQAGNRHILKFDGTNWTPVGQGIVGGGSSNIASMAVYNNELVVAGYFLNSAGNAGDLIMKWDGTTWRDVNWGAELNNGGILKLLVHQNKLFSFGTFNLSGNNKASKIAVYDGNIWCTYIDSLDNDIKTADIYHDTIYIGGAFKSITSDTSKKLVAKLLYPQNVNECNMVGLFEHSSFANEIKIYPNPTNNKVTINFSNVGSPQIEILNAQGESQSITRPQNQSSQIDFTNQPSGLYFLRYSDSRGQVSFKIIKN